MRFAAVLESRLATGRFRVGLGLALGEWSRLTLLGTAYFFDLALEVLDACGQPGDQPVALPASGTFRLLRRFVGAHGNPSVYPSASISS